MTAAPTHVVIGATDPQATVDLLHLVDLVEAERGWFSAEQAATRFGLDAPTAWYRLHAPGASRGEVLVVATPHTAPARSATDLGALAVDLYTADLDASLARLRAAGVEHGYAGTLELGPLVMRQCEITAPDGWRLVLVEANRRRPSVLDDDPDRLHSEVHSVLWTVPSIAAAAPAVQAATGLEQAHVFPIRHPELARIVGLPSEDTELVMNLMVDADQTPIRVELCEFPGHPAPRAPEPAATGPLTGGIHALGFGSDAHRPEVLPGGVRIER